MLHIEGLEIKIPIYAEGTSELKKVGKHQLNQFNLSIYPTAKQFYFVIPNKSKNKN